VLTQVVQASAKSLDRSPREADTKPVDKSARIAALDYLGTVASRLRKDAVAVSIDQNAVDDLVSLVCRENCDQRIALFIHSFIHVFIANKCQNAFAVTYD